MSDKILHVGKDDFQAEVLDSDIPVVVDFWAPWCAPCLVIGPVIEKLAVVYEGKVKFTKLNTDENQEIAVRYGIMGIPTIKIFKGGEEVDSLSGAVPEAYLKGFIDKSLD